MRQRLNQMMYVLRASYWFVPAIMAFLAIVLGGVTVWLDAGPAAGLLDGLGWYQKAKPDGAHEVLSTIAGSMITVAGVVFSITIVAIAFAASQYGPRILTNFMSDRGNQVTLGTFIATFVYCLVVLRTIRAGDDSEFVPQLAVMVGLLLALCSIAVLIYFIHHVPSSIHINSVAARIGRQLLRLIETQFPHRVGNSPNVWAATDAAESAEQPKGAGGEVAEIFAPATGYIEAVDDDTLMGTAQSLDFTVSVHHRPGDYVLCGKRMLSVYAAQSLTDDTIETLQRSFTIGTKRTPTQDLFFLIDELVEIGARALSSGVNDPYTAMTCLDWLSAAAADLSRRQLPSGRRADEKGVIRMLFTPLTFELFLARGFGRMRPYLAKDMNAAVHAFERLADVLSFCASSSLRDVVRAEADRQFAMAELELQGPAIMQVRERYHAHFRR